MAHRMHAVALPIAVLGSFCRKGYARPRSIFTTQCLTQCPNALRRCDPLVRFLSSDSARPPLTRFLRSLAHSICFSQSSTFVGACPLDLSRSGPFDLLLSSPNRVFRAWRFAALAARHDRGGTAVGRGFDHHLIGRIAQERPPHEMALDRLDGTVPLNRSDPRQNRGLPGRDGST